MQWKAAVCTTSCIVSAALALQSAAVSSLCPSTRRSAFCGHTRRQVDCANTAPSKAAMLRYIDVHRLESLQSLHSILALMRSAQVPSHRHVQLISSGCAKMCDSKSNSNDCNKPRPAAGQQNLLLPVPLHAAAAAWCELTAVSAQLPQRSLPTSLVTRVTSHGSASLHPTVKQRRYRFRLQLVFAFRVLRADCAAVTRSRPVSLSCAEQFDAVLLWSAVSTVAVA